MKQLIDLTVTKQLYNKRHFNVRDPKDLREYQKFLKTSSWGKNGCPFVVEYPYTNIPDMIKTEVLNHYLGTVITVLEKKSKPAKQ
jgi:hypothetical protein